MQNQAKLSLYLERHWLNALIALLLACLYLPLLIHWVDGWVNKSISIEHEYFSHGMIGIPYAAYIAWTNRRKWQKLEDRSHPVGAILLGLGAVFYLSGTNELVNLSFPVVLAGICLWLKGWPGLKLNGFPLGFVLFSTPNAVPYLLTPFTLPLQVFIAGVAGFTLYYLGMTDIAVEGSYITVGGRLVEVAPYCAGLKMLFTSLFVAVMLLHWTGLWRSHKKIILLLIGTVIISVGVNIFRNTILTFLHGSGMEGLFAFTHEGLGGDLISLMMLVLVVVWLDVLERLYNLRDKGENLGILSYEDLLAVPLGFVGLSSNKPSQPKSSEDKPSQPSQTPTAESPVEETPTPTENPTAESPVEETPTPTENPTAESPVEETPTPTDHQQDNSDPESDRKPT